jgi:hypothetical protein
MHMHMFSRKPVHQKIMALQWQSWLEQVASKFILLVKALAVDPTEQYEYWQMYLQSIEAHYAHAHFSRKPVHQKIMALQWQS